MAQLGKVVIGEVFISLIIFFHLLHYAAPPGIRRGGSVGNKAAGVSFARAIAKWWLMLCLITTLIPEEFLLKIQLLSDAIIASTAEFTPELL